MKIITCYTVPIQKQLLGPAAGGTPVSVCAVDDRLMRTTSGVCLDALKYCADVFLKEWNYLSSLKTTQKAGTISRKRGADLLIHSTAVNKAKYPDFDIRFAYMPAYIRRAIIADALGLVSSYVSNHRNWEAEDPADRGGEPVIGFPERYELTFYDQERDLCDIGKGIIGLKLYNGQSWEWYYFRISLSDAKYISRMNEKRKMLSPVVEKVKGRYQIRFSFEEERKLVSDEDPLGYRILVVDLGINAPASWSVMTSDGTVHSKGVIHLESDEDRLGHLINRKRMFQQAGKKPHAIYRMITEANRQLSIDTTKALMEIAVLYDVDCIVFEHLDRKGARKGRKFRERIHMWRANDVQKRIELQAHRNGMRISRICAWNTSKLAFDGSGPVTRDKNNYSICVFTSGKKYNCDLSASMNIGARYFLRLLAKTKGCPEMPATPQRTHATLLMVNSQMRAA